MNTTVAQIRRMIADAIRPVSDRHRDSLRRVKILKSDDSGKTRLLQVQGLRGAVESNVEHLEPFGFSSNPPEGSEGFEIRAGGSPSHPVIIVAFGRDYRLHVEPGESIQFNQQGDFVKIDKNRKITVNAGGEVDVTAPNVKVTATTKVTITSPNTEITGNLTVDQNLMVTQNLTVQGTSALTGLLTANAGATITGAVAITGALTATSCSVTTMTVNGKDFTAHIHSGVTVGANNTGHIV